MRKKTILIVALAVVGVLGAVFAVLNIHAPNELSIWQKKEIEYHFQKQFDREWGPWDVDIDMNNHLQAHTRYYGTENGYLILYKQSGSVWWTALGQKIGKYSFVSEVGQTFEMFAYKAGKFLYLKDAYAQGLISDEAIKAAWEIHRQYPDSK